MSVKELVNRVAELEGQLGLNSEGLPSSKRLLALLDALAGTAPVEKVPEAADLASGPIEARLAKLQQMAEGSSVSLNGQEAASDTVEGKLAAILGALDGRGEDQAGYDSCVEKVQGTNINDLTLLATDYLNHFNEVVMTIDMVPDMPELLEDAHAWKPKTYQDHFRDSSVADKDLAVEVYAHVPPRFKEPFETTVAQVNDLILSTVDILVADSVAGNADMLRENASLRSRMIQKLLDTAGAIIHGSNITMEQSEIDDLFP